MVTLNTNVQALNANRLINVNSANLARTTERLSSGLRINRAADDPSGLGIAAVLTSQIRGDSAATNNIQQAQSMIQVADAALGQVGDILQRMRELAVQANNSSLSTSQATALNAEFASLRTAITNIATGATFNGRPLLTGTTGNVTLQIGAATTSTSTIAFGVDYRLGAGAAVDLSNDTLTTTAGAQTAQNELDTAITFLSTGRSTLGAQSQQLEYLKSALDSTIIANADARSRIQDADVAAEVSSLVRQQLLQQTGASALAAANFAPQFVVSLLQ